VSAGWLRVELTERHSGVSDVGAGANCEIGEAADEALVIDENFVVTNVGDKGRIGSAMKLCDFILLSMILQLEQGVN